MEILGDNKEDVAGAACIGAPLLGRSGRLVAALSISGPAERILANQQKIVAALRSAREISERLGCPKGAAGFPPTHQQGLSGLQSSRGLA